MPSSTLPSQSLSALSQTSTPGALGSQMVAPFTQAVVPGPQAPGSPLSQTSLPTPSSVLPSQSSSIALQVSGRGSASVAEHSTAPLAAQTFTPLPKQAPTPIWQASPAPVPSSTLPSQSSSAPLHVSAIGSRGAALQVTPPRPSQIFSPTTLQTPTPALQASPRPVPSSMLPSQSLSFASQISASG